MRFTKIRFNGETVELAWREDTETDHSKTTLKSKELPEPEFDAALQGFVSPLLAIIEADPTYADDLIVKSVSVKYKDDDRRGVVVSAVKEVGATNSPFVINSPYLLEVGEDDDAEPSIVAAALFDALDALVEQAHRGHRSQQAFDFPAGADDDTAGGELAAVPPPPSTLNDTAPPA